MASNILSEHQCQLSSSLLGNNLLHLNLAYCWILSSKHGGGMITNNQSNRNSSNNKCWSSPLHIKIIILLVWCTYSPCFWCSLELILSHEVFSLSSWIIHCGWRLRCWHLPSVFSIDERTMFRTENGVFRKLKNHNHFSRAGFVRSFDLLLKRFSVQMSGYPIQTNISGVTNVFPKYNKDNSLTYIW